ncbi:MULTISPECIES: SDR family NAD(P)-dependent oxidoreductase [unclassified Polaribacter]|jgi:NADP-dependent 3-hydroxy acid dehydrogenase YdfG|uniref:SDR family NAD(P)-dependent oxidoreductase n=1 Tax=unclassified Polaribacter TaxID=196858 RepID=UPI00052D6A43|nr:MULTISPECIES: SDR family NAD(P)-dependent oxidoreductase [unclassified Polaribacter]KGL60195.1 oxidoreductase, short chain dehydrogenase/reductase family [Polaribacter sp. Hel1_33_49]MBT3742429.1 SDR family NAD(P)-dependent oxidoreductase [Polaribacter sp.]MBT4414271.1 SDR family NAD(P)-dependent oxidoreductase [Polaribacter sp.]MBT7816760.1 SDR family NAD(P)-dependent oxidoreductase [Polaribacter sp.]MDG1195627.1 SDR family NAD(P)-dependent oxidoreductase [Polaribacter sp.]
MNKTAFITGATSGIGKATAEIFAKNNIRLILCGRRAERLKELQNELSKLTEVTTLQFDVSKRTEVEAAMNALPENFKQIDILINNAGNAHGLSTIQDGNVDDWDAMLDINVKGLLYVSKAIIPQMIENNNGFIVNIGSTAGKEVYKNGNVYCASKFAVNALNKSMRLDLNEHNIRVSAIHPGLVQTEFSEVRFKGDIERAETVYKGYKALQAEDVADIIHFVITRPYHVNIEDLVVFPTAQASATMIHKT